MEVESCGRCAGWNSSPRNVVEFLRGQWNACENCHERAIMRVVMEQFQARQTRWWVVDKVIVVPIWIVEFLKMHPELWSASLQPSGHASVDGTDEAPVSTCC